MGSGSASTANQEFTLRQSPLTYVQAPTPTGRLSTLQVRANGVAWTAVPSLYDQGSGDQVYATLDLAGGGTLVEFGDGVEGATLPTGQNNVQGSYRVGSGSAGNVAAGAITTLVDRPVGVSGVTNPLPATGGQDAQSPDGIRANAPQSVLTLGRAVSITDYQDLAASFAGIAKACATWIPGGAYRGVLLTVAGAGGAALPAGNPDPGQPRHRPAELRQPQRRRVRAVVPGNHLPAQPPASVTTPLTRRPPSQAAIMQTLTQTYSFTARSFGQGVSGDEIAALIQGIPGVVAVNVTALSVVATSRAGDIGSCGLFRVRLQRLDGGRPHAAAPAPLQRLAHVHLPLRSGRDAQRAAPARRDPGPRPGPEERPAGGDDVSSDLFELLPAVYRLRDAQIAQSQQLADRQPRKPTLSAAAGADRRRCRPISRPSSIALTAKAARGPAAVPADGRRGTVRHRRRRPRPALRRSVHRDVRALGHPLHRRPDRLPVGTRASLPRSTIPAPRSPRRSRCAAARERCWSWSSSPGTSPDGAPTRWSSSRCSATPQYMNHVRPRQPLRAGPAPVAARLVHRTPPSTARRTGSTSGGSQWTRSLQHPERRHLPVVPRRVRHHRRSGDGGRDQHRGRQPVLPLQLAGHGHARCSTARYRRVSRSAPRRRPVNVAARLRRRVLCADLQGGVGADFYGPAGSLAAHPRRHRRSIPIRSRSPTFPGPTEPGPTSPRTATTPSSIDPELGRIALPPPSRRRDRAAAECSRITTGSTPTWGAATTRARTASWSTTPRGSCPSPIPSACPATRRCRGCRLRDRPAGAHR